MNEAPRTGSTISIQLVDGRGNEIATYRAPALPRPGDIMSVGKGGASYERYVVLNSAVEWRVWNHRYKEPVAFVQCVEMGSL